MTLQDFLAKAHELFLGPTVVALTKERDDLIAEREAMKEGQSSFAKEALVTADKIVGLEKTVADLKAELATAKTEVETTKAALAEAEKKAVKIIAAASITEDTAGKAAAQPSKEKELTGLARTIAAMKAGKK